MPKCETCGEDIEKGKTHKHKGGLFVHRGKVVCESCLVDTGVPISEAQPYDVYERLQTERHRGGLDI
ncbi:MAG: hypothetical protein JSU79_07180 [Dehalococcoidales bacterium]|nr:MAG: hypothetical protein JSU79_07180 [Dehalococcoidales bacterium]